MKEIMIGDSVFASRIMPIFDKDEIIIRWEFGSWRMGVVNNINSKHKHHTYCVMFDDGTLEHFSEDECEFVDMVGLVSDMITT